MVKCASKSIGFFCLLWGLTFAEERVYRETESERRWNTPPELTPEQVNRKSNHDNDSIQPRFLPFSASFTLSSGGVANNAHSLSVGGGNNGLSFAQSASQFGSSIGNEGTGISASQSSSFSAGLSGISSAESNSFSINHPAFGANSQANSNSFAVGQANSAAQGNVVNGQATSVAQSATGLSHSSASSGASSSSGLSNSRDQDYRRGRPTWTNVSPNRQAGGVYVPNNGRPRLHVTHGAPSRTQRLPTRRPIRLNIGVGEKKLRRPEVFIREQRPDGYRGHRQGATSVDKHWSLDQEVRPAFNKESWTQNPLTGPTPGTWSQSNEDGNNSGLQVSGVSASSSSSSNAAGGSVQSHSSSHSSLGPNGPTSWTNNNVQTSGDAQSQAQGGAAAVGQNCHGNSQGSFSSGAVAGGSQGTGNSQGQAVSGNRGQNSRGQVTSFATGTSFVQGTSNTGSINHVRFPGSENPHNIPREFVRATNSRSDEQRRKSRTKDPVDAIFTEISDTVADIFDV